MAQALEIFPLWLVGVPLEDVVPLLGGTGEMEGSEPNFLILEGALRAKELVTTIELAQGVIFAIEGGESKLVVARHCGLPCRWHVGKWW